MKNITFIHPFIIALKNYKAWRWFYAWGTFIRLCRCRAPCKWSFAFKTERNDFEAGTLIFITSYQTIICSSLIVKSIENHLRNGGWNRVSDFFWRYLERKNNTSQDSRLLWKKERNLTLVFLFFNIFKQFAQTLKFRVQDESFDTKF